MALVKEDGSAVAKAPGGTVLEAVAETDPMVKVLIPIYEESPYENVEFPTQKLQLKYRANQVIRQSQWDANFVVPTVASVTPATGSDDGGTVITIRGTAFTDTATVTVGGANATAIDVDSATKLKATTPAGTAGARDVVVATAGGSGTKTGGFTYTA